MSLTLIREERITQTGNGLQLDDDLYIKLDAAFDELIADLGRDGQLPALLHIQLREAHASSGRGNPATVKTIAHATSRAERQAKRIIKSLLGKSLIVEAGVSPKTGEKFYRPLGYAWFGNRRSPPRGVSSVTPLSHDTPMSPVVVADQYIQDQAKDEKQQQTEDRVRELLRAAGIFGNAQLRLAETVSAELAHEWGAWVRTAPKGIRNPAGLMISALVADPQSRPPKPLLSDERSRRPSITGALAETARRRAREET